MKKKNDLALPLLMAAILVLAIIASQVIPVIFQSMAYKKQHLVFSKVSGIPVQVLRDPRTALPWIVVLAQGEARAYVSNQSEVKETQFIQQPEGSVNMAPRSGKIARILYDRAIAGNPWLVIEGQYVFPITKEQRGSLQVGDKFVVESEPRPAGAVQPSGKVMPGTETSNT